MTVDQANAPRVFVAHKRVGLHAAGYIAGGVVYLLVLLLPQFLLAATARRRSNDMMPGMVGGLSVLGVFLIARGVFLLRSTVRVVLDGAGVHLEGLIARRSVWWSDIDRLEQDKRTAALGGKRYQVLKLIGANGKPLASIYDTILDFDSLAAEIAARSTAARGRATYDPAHDEQRRISKQSRQMRWVSVLFGLFTIGMGAALVAGINEEIHTRKYDTEGVRTNANIVRRYKVRITPRLEYSFTDDQGRTHGREVMMLQDDWDALKGQQTVPIIYLPSNPEWNRPVSGEEKGAEFGGGLLLLWTGGLLMFGTFCVISMLGYDLKVEDGQTTLVRRGKVIRTWGKRKEEPIDMLSALAGPSDEAEAPIPGSPPAYSAPPNYGIPASYPSPPGYGFPHDVAPQPAPGWAPPYPNSYPPAPMAASKPRGIVALGVLSIVFGGLGVLMNCARLLLLSQRTLQLGQGQSLVLDTPAWLLAWNGVDALLAIGLLVAGIGLVVVKRWGRAIGIPVAALQVLSSLGAIAVAIRSMADLSNASGRQASMAMAGSIGAILGQMLGMVFPLVLLPILAKRSSGEAFGPTHSPNRY